MFFNFKAAHHEVVKENQELRDKLEVAERRLAALELANIKRHDCEPAIDFNAMRVFSIERNTSCDVPVTILGYYMQEPVISSDGEMIVMRDIVCEWTLYCNEERHADLVKQFRQHNDKKQQTVVNVPIQPQPYVHSRV